MFVGVDRAIFVASFAERLRRAGISVAVTSIERCAMALDAVGPLTLRDLYWTCRISLLSDRRQLATFDAVFDAVFEAEMGRLPAGRRGQQPNDKSHLDDRLVPLHKQVDEPAAASDPVPWATLPSISFDDATGTDDDQSDDDQADELAIPELRPSTLAPDMDRPFDLLDEEELERVGQLLESSIVRWPHRRSRRTRNSRSAGPIAMRRSFRHAMQSGGDVVTLLHNEQRRQPRRVVVLLDMSGSMESYARAYLHMARPLAINHRAEVFAFATELTRITPAVRLRSAQEAIDHVTDSVGDRFTGTRLATCMRTLLAHRTWNTTVRGAIVVICSDGWDADAPEQLDRTMSRLALLAHRVIWVNPRVAADDFEPRTGGMAAALPHCDDFLAGHTGNAMHDVIEAITCTR